ncbi:MAG: GNAT family N-acetyltransferase [Thermoguttaceae bacterium]|nr:GNAT family N-acetyltransferase [Thermoguttaceae bacterium]
MIKNDSSLQFPRVRYVKRLRMSIDFEEYPEAAAGPKPLPNGFVWIPWDKHLTEVHGEVKFLAFRDSYDSEIFPTFRSRSACLGLMRSIASHSGFLPEGTWLIARRAPGCSLPIPVNDRNEYQLRSPKPESEQLEFIATIQGIRTAPRIAAIQNVAVRPEFCGRGFGRAILMKGLEGFYRAGIRKVTLEATGGNVPAVRLYETSGFHLYQTLYKEVYVS